MGEIDNSLRIKLIALLEKAFSTPHGIYQDKEHSIRFHLSNNRDFIFVEIDKAFIAFNLYRNYMEYYDDSEVFWDLYPMDINNIELSESQKKGIISIITNNY